MVGIPEIGSPDKKNWIIYFMIWFRYENIPKAGLDSGYPKLLLTIHSIQGGSKHHLQQRLQGAQPSRDKTGTVVVEVACYFLKTDLAEAGGSG